MNPLKTEETSSNLADDLLIGAKPIADFTGLDPRQVYHAAAKGHIPTFYIGPKIAARKSELRAALSARAARATDPEAA
jgi:hypothetical protein